MDFQALVRHSRSRKVPVESRSDRQENILLSLPAVSKTRTYAVFEIIGGDMKKEVM